MDKFFLDNDLYKFTMMRAIRHYYPNEIATYQFINRGGNKFTKESFNSLKEDIENLKNIVLTRKEYNFISKNCHYLDKEFLEFLSNYEFNVDSIDVKLDEKGNLYLTIKDYWYKSVLLEVPLMSLISKNYFKYVDTNWNRDDQERKVDEKYEFLKNIKFADFGTRRRRNYYAQDYIINRFSSKGNKNFVGTSNVHFAQKYNIKPIGTMAHEWIMGNSAIHGLKKANEVSLKKWMDIFNGELGIALTDTYGISSFFESFNGNLSRLFDGVRHDSGDPYHFINETITHYKNLRIDPLSKTIVFSDGLTPKIAYDLNEYCKNKINCSFGIGTNFTNDFTNSKPLNMVIKLVKINNDDVVKLSSVKGKAVGDKDALRVARWVFYKIPLDYDDEI